MIQTVEVFQSHTTPVVSILGPNIHVKFLDQALSQPLDYRSKLKHTGVPHDVLLPT